MSLKTIDQIKADILRGRISLSTSLARLALWMFNNPADVAFGTVQSIAGCSGMPQSAVRRLAGSFGFDGFRSMKKAFQAFLVARAAHAPLRDLSTTVHH